MPDDFGLAVEGVAKLTKVFNKAPADERKAYKNELRTIALPVKQDYERLNRSEIRRMRFSPQWAETRVGVTQKLVYVVPKKKGSHGRGRSRRPNLARLMSVRAATPALNRNKARIQRDFERMLDRLVAGWDREGPKNGK